jgi:hypothetical protein
VELDHAFKTISGEPSKIIDAKLADTDAPVVPAEELRHWFLSHGFIETERYSGLSVLGRGHEDTFLGKQVEITLDVPLDEAEIDHLYIRFLLTKNTPTQWNEWESLIWELESEYQFKIMASDESLVPCIDFFSLLLNNHNFQTFQKNYRWNTERSSPQ